MNFPKLISIYAPAAQSGKSTVASVLFHGWGYRVVKFAGPLKSMVRGLCASIDMPSEVINRALEGDLKEAPLAQLGGVTPRHLMETLGTGWGRNMIDQEFWTRLARAHWSGLLAKGNHLVNDDLRFPNEYHTIKSLGGMVIKVWRPGYEPKHMSEGHLSKDYPFDAVFTNDGTLEQLQERVRHWLIHVAMPNYKAPEWTGSQQSSR